MRQISESEYDAVTCKAGGTLPPDAYHFRAGDSISPAPFARPPADDVLEAIRAALLADDDERREAGRECLGAGRATEVVREKFAPLGGPCTSWFFRFGTDRGYDLVVTLTGGGSASTRRMRQGYLETTMGV